MRDLVQNGIFGSLVSSVSSIVSRKSSRTNIHGSDDHVVRHYTKGDVDTEESIQLHDMSGANSASAERVDGADVPKHGAIHVSKGYAVGGRHD